MAQDAQSGKSEVETPGKSVSNPGAMFQTFASKWFDVFVTDNNPAAGWFEMNQHWIDFLGARFQRDRALFQKLCKCANATEISAACDAFSNEMIQDYRLEFAEMSELA